MIIYAEKFLINKISELRNSVTLKTARDKLAQAKRTLESAEATLAEHERTLRELEQELLQIETLNRPTDPSRGYGDGEQD